jgi:hypothetical protein
MKKIFLILALCFAMLLSGCHSPSEPPSNSTGDNQEVAGDGEGFYEPTMPDSQNMISLGEPGRNPHVQQGNLFYIIEKSGVYQSIKECGLNENVFLFPSNTYSLDEAGEQLRATYREMSDYIHEDGSVVDTHRLIVLDITIRNENALGNPKKKEFNIYDFGLLGGKPTNTYYMSYFSEAGKIAGSDQPFHYNLEQGKEIKAQIGFFVLKEDVEKKMLVGVNGMGSENQINFDLGI